MSCRLSILLLAFAGPFQSNPFLWKHFLHWNQPIASLLSIPRANPVGGLSLHGASSLTSPPPLPVALLFSLCPSGPPAQGWHKSTVNAKLCVPTSAHPPMMCWAACLFDGPAPPSVCTGGLGALPQGRPSSVSFHPDTGSQTHVLCALLSTTTGGSVSRLHYTTIPP
jgi:hypothetical protein